MSEILIDKEVYFHEYCPKCIRSDESSTNDICDHCLSNPVNQNSHKPVDFKEKESRNGKNP